MPHWLELIGGESGGDTLSDLFAKLGNNTTAFWAAIGYEGATALASKLTAARAALIDQITAARLGELDPANLPADIDTLLLRLTALRAGYLDELDFDLSARLGAPAGASISADLLTIDNLVDDLETRLTAVRAGYLDNLSGGAVALAASWTAALATALGNYTAARAAYLDNINNAQLLNITAARLGYIDLLADGTVGLAAIEALVDDLETRLTAARAGYLDFLATTEVAGPFSYLDAGGEQDVYENAVVTRRHVKVEFSNRNMTQTGTFRLYRKVDGATYDLYVAQAVLVAAGSERAFDAEFTTNQHWKLTYQENVDEGAARAVPYNVILQVVE